MKRLGFFAFGTILLLSILWVTQPSTVFAQNSPAATKTQLQSKADTLFSNFTTQLVSKQNSPKQIPALANASDADIAKYVEGNKELVAVVSVGKTTFTDLFQNPSAPSTNIYADFTAALNAASSRINQGQANSANIRNNALLREEVRALSSQINSLAQERQQELINSGNTSEAANIQNAVGAQRTDQANKELTVGKCTSLFNASIVDCIDAGFAWLIKNTLLQIAGFLAWLSANMLNLAIQFSILDFAKWSPTSLYPIWVIIRQIVSLVVVFAGLYLGFMYIIGREDTFGKYVGWLVVFALFVNFSYPVTRALVDVSNVVSLNVYSSAVGSEALSGTGGNTAGALIISKLGLTELFVSATTNTTESGFNTRTGSGFVGQINTVPGALAAVAFALYAAFVLFMATGILVMRAAIFSFLIVASPLLLVDAVVPKLGDVAVKMRKMFFEQLIVAPVFMLMLALTLKFMDVFQTGPLANGGDSVKVFFNLLMMTIMLHIMLKVTKTTAGAAGEMATSAMGKVGGFGLGVASGGAGFLARGSVGMAAARMRDSGWMDKMQGSKMGRGLYGLSNSLAQSTFDTRNLGMVNRGMASAGMGMGKGTAQTYDKDFEARDVAMKKKYGSIKDGSARDGYIAQKTGSLGSVGQQTMLLGRAKSDAQKTADNIKKGEDKSIETYAKIKDEDKKREHLESLPENVQARIKNEGGASQVQATKAETVEDEQKMNPTPVSASSGEKDWSAYDTPAVNRGGGNSSAGTNRSANWASQGDVNVPAAERKGAEIKMGPNDGPQKPPTSKKVEEMSHEEIATELKERTIKSEEAKGIYRNDPQKTIQENQKKELEKIRGAEERAQEAKEVEATRKAQWKAGNDELRANPIGVTKASATSKSFKERIRNRGGGDVIDVEAREVGKVPQLNYVSNTETV